MVHFALLHSLFTFLHVKSSLLLGCYALQLVYDSDLKVTLNTLITNTCKQQS